MTIELEMTEKDFERLSTTSMRWGNSWAAHDGRFEHMTKSYDTPPSYRWAMAYWVGEDWSHVMLCRAFLASQGHDFEVMWDKADPGEYVILTDYMTASWAKHEGTKGEAGQ